MSSRFAYALIAASALGITAIAQTTSPSAPAPRRDISGIWEPRGGIQGIGPQNMPGDGKPGHEPLYTPFGLELLKLNKPTRGIHEVLTGEENDPAHVCDPQGFPRENLFELRTTQIIHTPVQTVILYSYDKIWRTIWTDGRELPKDPDPRWFGYSVGKWADDSTFVIQTNGTDDRTWIDNTGRPHTEELRTEEVFHRIDRDNMELSMTIDDPKVYAKPWMPLNKLPFKLRPPNTELPEMMCSPSEMSAYLKKHATRGSVKK